MFLFLYFFIIFGLFSSIMAIFSKNTIHSILFLILVFCNVTGLLLMLNVEYLAMVFVIVYIGAIAVLFLFVVMMLNLKLLDRHDSLFKYLPVGGLISSLLLLELSFLYDNYATDSIFNSNFRQPFQDDYIDWLSMLTKSTNIQDLGQIMYTYYFIPFILSSLILLIAMVGSITLTLNDNVRSPKRQDLHVQINRKISDSISLIK